MKERSRFAPVTTGPSSLLDLAAGYFYLLAVVPLAIGVFGLAIGMVFRWSTLNLLVGSLTSVAYACGYIWVGRKLAAGKKIGGFIALGLTVLSLATQPDGYVIIWNVLSLLVIALIWRSLD